MTNQGLCKNCGSLITLDDSSENCKCVFCHCVFPKEEAVKLLEDQEDLSFPNEVYEDPDQTVPAVYDEGRYDNEFIGNARILEEHEVYEPKENVVAGIVGAMLFALIGGVVWFFMFQIGFISAVGGLVGVVLANIGYSLFAKRESLKGVIISVLAAIVAIAIACYMCLALDCYNAFQSWYASGEIDYTITFIQAVRGAYRFLAEPEIARSYIFDFALGLFFCAIGACRYVLNAIDDLKRKKKTGE